MSTSIKSPTTVPCARTRARRRLVQASKDCDWVAKKPEKYCSKDDGNDWAALDACVTTCDTCECEDSTTWHRAGKASKGCAYVAKKPEKYCDYEGEDGTFAFESWLVPEASCWHARVTTRPVVRSHRHHHHHRCCRY